jgi:membrane associated rhomboid family serine protease
MHAAAALGRAPQVASPASSLPRRQQRRPASLPQQQQQWRPFLLSLGRRPCRPPAAGNNESLSDDEISALLAKYDQASPKPSIPPRSRAAQQQPAASIPAAAPAARRAKAPASTPATGNGTFLLCFLCLAVFLADNVLHLPFARSLYLVHGFNTLVSPWWTVLTHAFCHANWQHLSANLFPLLVFGKLIEETEGAAGVIFYYCLTAAGAALASVWLSSGPAIVSVGASGAVFGLFAIAVLTRLSPDPRKLLEFFILGQFVVGQVLSEARAQVAGGTMLAGGLAVSHVAHLAGALAGVLLVMLLRAIPEPPPDG